MINGQEIAVSAVKEIYDLWKIDSDRVEWVGDTSASGISLNGYGFDWWPGDFKVVVRVTGPHPEFDKPIYRLSVQTDFLRDVDVTAPKFKNRLSLLNRFSPTFSICAHPKGISQILKKYESSTEKFDLDLKSSKVWLASTAYLHEGIKGWLPRFFAGLAILQPIEAQFRAELAIPLLGGSLHRSGSQKSLDDILNVEGSVFAAEGKKQSKWVGTGEFEEIIKKWGRCDTGFGFAEKEGLSIETPFGDHTAILLIKTNVPHPRLGNGLLAILKIPLLSELDRANEFCIELNYAEAGLWSQGSAFIGNWSANEAPLEGSRGSAFGPAFSSFIPNVLYGPGLAENVVLYMINRARWVRHIWLPNTSDLPMHEILSKRYPNVPKP